MILYKKPIKAQVSYLTNDPMFMQKMKYNQFANNALNYWDSKQYGIETTPVLEQVTNNTFNNDILKQSSQTADQKAGGFLKNPSTVNTVATLGDMAIGAIDMGIQNKFNKK